MEIVLYAAVGLVAGLGARNLTTRLAGRPPARGACEAACGGGVAVAALVGPTPAATLLLAALVWWCVCLSAVDLLVRRLPNVLTVPGAVAVVALAAGAGSGRAALAGAGLLAGPMLLAHLASPRSLGAGDVKLAVGVGAAAGVAGPVAWLLVAAGPPLLTATAGLLMRVGQRWRPRAGPGLVPHGPSMCAVTVLALLTVA
ncbi:prepilin peptidase [Rhodococcus zopfii]|uniref:prepilin peptidase n=1 Tax=Rhodococcus zopfii TaxID=43772 RepID=UPI0011112A0A|nr:prepilin peptidase [Rhodococcus zopfii]